MSNPSRSARRAALLAAGVTALMGGAAIPAGAATVSLPDGRVLELVTPTTSPNVDVNALPFAQVGADGNEVAFETLGDRNVGPSANLETYLSTRTPGGWSVKLLTPPEAASTFNWYPAHFPPNPFFAFSSDLSETVFDAAPASPLTPADPPDSDNVYVQDTATGADTLVNTAGPDLSFIGPRVAAVSPDFRHVVFDDGGGVANNYYNLPEPGQIRPPEVYVWSADQGMSLASILPDGRIGTGNAVTSHGISDDGSRIFWQGSAGVGHVYERRDQGLPDASTVQLDVPAPGAPVNATVVGGAYSSQFITATSDGHQALFQSCAPLTADSTASIVSYDTCDNFDDFSSSANKNDLYIYDEDGNAGAGSLTDISTGDPNGAKVLGVVGASSDLSRVYFVALGNLTGTAPTPNDYCQTPAGDAPNLYVWDKTDGVKFIAQLQAPSPPGACWFTPQGDVAVWENGIDAEHKQAAVSAGGDYVAFATYAAIDPAYDNIDPTSGYPHQEVYIYKYGSAGPICVSCVGSGPALSDATIANQQLTTVENELQNFPGWQKRNLLDNGTLFFESADKLVSGDDNTTTDVYEYKAGPGTLSLISSGRSTQPSNFMGATADGSNVFFSTDQSLLPSDIDNNIDIYDARVAGGVANTPPPSGCQSGCSPPPGTSTFVGPGNPKPTVVVPGPRPVAFALARLTSAQIASLARTGTVTLTITAPGAGRVSARALARLGRGAATTIASASAPVRGAGPLRLTLRLSGKARAALKKAGHLAVEIVATFGKSTKTARVTLVRARR
jgi:hypothetical protein